MRMIRMTRRENRSVLLSFVTLSCVSVVVQSTILVDPSLRRLRSPPQQQVVSTTARLLQTNYDELVHLPLTPGHVLQRRRVLEQQQQQHRALDDETPQQEEGHAQQVDALYQGYGEHYVDLWCGTPPQRQTVILNTGAKGTAFPCSQCQDDCGLDYHTDNYFEEKNSFTFHQYSCDECQLGTCGHSPDGCLYGMAYAEGSTWQALESKDLCYIGGLHQKPISIDECTKKKEKCDDLDPEHAVAFAFNLRFGCQTRVTGYFRTQLADGILGMNNSPHSFWKQMYDAGKMKDERFSLCYVRQQHALKNGTESGAMTLGGSDDRLHLNPMVFTKHEERWNENFGVLMRKIHLRQGGGGDSINSTDPDLNIVTLDITAEQLNRGPVIIESGTTDTYFTAELEEPLQQAWNQLMGTRYTQEVLTWSYEEIQTLPTFIFQFQGSEELNKQVGNPDEIVNLAGSLDPDHPYDVLLAVPPNHYMQFDERENGYVARIYAGEPLGMSTIGANSMMGHDVLFDIKNQRIGWAESHCDYDHLVEQAGFDETGKDQPPIPAPGSPTAPNYAPAPAPADAPGSPGDSMEGNSLNEKSNAEESGICGGRFGCQFSIVFLVGFTAVLMVVRQGKFGVFTEQVRRMTGGGGSLGIYSNMNNGYADAAILGEGVSSELELQESDRGTKLSFT